MKIQRNVCKVAEANVLCCVNEAALCWACDEKVHAANKLASKHQRVPVSAFSSNICPSAIFAWLSYLTFVSLLKVVLSTLAFIAFELTPNGAIGTKILEFLFHLRSDLVNIRSIDEAVVIGAALYLLQLLFYRI